MDKTPRRRPSTKAGAPYSQRRNRDAAPRRNETIGGGFFVFRRGKKTGRISVSQWNLQFEHATLAEALAEAARLAAKHPGETYEVFATTGALALCQVEPETAPAGAQGAPELQVAA